MCPGSGGFAGRLPGRSAGLVEAWGDLVRFGWSLYLGGFKTSVGKFDQGCWVDCVAGFSELGVELFDLDLSPIKPCDNVDIPGMVFA